MVVVKLAKRPTRVVRVDPKIQALIHIRNVRDELARILSYNTAGAGIPTAGRHDLLRQMEQSYYRRFGEVADVRQLRV